MKYSLRSMTALAACWLVVACAAKPGIVSPEPPVDVINNKQGLALEGYDPVAYFTDRKPTLGNPQIESQWSGATYRFATVEHRDLFSANPQRYAPQFGGYCAYAVSRGTTANGDPFQWAVVDQKLYVNNNAIASRLWNRDRPGNIEAGHTNWPLIAKRPVAGESADAAPH